VEERLKVDARRVAAASAVLAREGGVWLKFGQKPIPSRAAIALTLPAARATSTLLSTMTLWKVFFFATFAATARLALSACAAHCASWMMSSLVVAKARHDEQIVPEHLDTPDIEAERSADIAARVDVGQDREVAGEVLVLEENGAVLLVGLGAQEGVISLLDGDDVAEMLLEERGEVLDAARRC